MSYMARLLTITRYENITEDIRPFIEFQATQKKVELEPGTRVAVLQVENIPSYYVIFIDSGITFDEILSELKAQELGLNEDAKKTIKQLIEEKQDQ